MYRKFSLIYEEGVKLFEKIAPLTVGTIFMPERSTEDDRAVVESSISYHRFLIYEPADSSNVHPVHGGLADRDLASSVLYRMKEICESSRNLDVYPYLCYLDSVTRWQRLGFKNLHATDEDVKMIQQVRDKVENGLLGLRPFSPPSWTMLVLEAGLAFSRGNSHERSPRGSTSECLRAIPSSLNVSDFHLQSHADANQDLQDQHSLKIYA